MLVMLKMEFLGKRTKGRPKKIFMDGNNQNIKIVGVIVKDANDRASWKKAICYRGPWSERPKEREESDQHCYA